MTNSYTPASLMSAVCEHTLAETRLTETPLLGMLSANARLQDQHEIKWSAKLTDAEIGGRAVAGTLEADTKGSLGKASLAIPDYYFKYHMVVNKRDLIEAAATGEVQAVRDAVGTEVDDAMRSLTQQMNKVLYTGVGTLNDTSFGVLGLNEIVKQTGTYGGISRSTYPRWKSLVEAGATPGTAENLTVDRVTELMRTRRKAGATHSRNNGSNLIALTSDEIETDVMRKLFQAETQTQADYANIVANVSPYAGYAIQGIPVVSDVVDSVDNKIFFVDPSKLHLYVYNDNSDVAMNDEKISFFGYNGLQFRMATVNDNHPDVVEMEISTSIQLKAHDPIQTVSVLDDVDNTIA